MTSSSGGRPSQYRQAVVEFGRALQEDGVAHPPENPDPGPGHTYFRVGIWVRWGLAIPLLEEISRKFGVVIDGFFACDAYDPLDFNQWVLIVDGHTIELGLPLQGVYRFPVEMELVGYSESGFTITSPQRPGNGFPGSS